MADYLRRFLSDPRICPMNQRLWHFILNRFIIPKRAPLSAEKYRAIWCDQGSPLVVSMTSLTRKLREVLPRDNIVYVGHAMSYSAPSIEDALAECNTLGCDEVIVLPLYPQSAFCTTGVVKDQLDLALARLGWNPQVTFVDSYCDEENYINAVASSISSAGCTLAAGDKLLFAFHSIPMADIRAGDTYEMQAHRTAIRVTEKLVLDDSSWRIGYQCRFDKSRAWLGPSTTEALEELAGSKRLFVVAPNFSIDCLETLYDIDIKLRSVWSGKGLDSSGDTLRYVPCLNDSEEQINLLCGIILRVVENSY